MCIYFKFLVKYVMFLIKYVIFLVKYAIFLVKYVKKIDSNVHLDTLSYYK